MHQRVYDASDCCLQDFDGGTVGATIIEAYMNNTGQKQQVSWYTVPASMFPNGESDIPDAIVDERAWAAIASTCYYHLAHRDVHKASACSPRRGYRQAQRCCSCGQRGRIR